MFRIQFTARISVFEASHAPRSFAARPNRDTFYIFKGIFHVLERVCGAFSTLAQESGTS